MIFSLCMCAFFPALFGAVGNQDFPAELVEFTPYEKNPVFEGRGPGFWDETIRERGWILKEDGVYHLWYTGYTFPESNSKKLGYATSSDGITWTRYPGNPIYAETWVEDMTVVKMGDTYYMFAEGEKDQAHLLTSKDRIHWTRQGKLDIRKHDGEPIPPGPFGTPAVIYDKDTWYLFYERDDVAIWLASSKDLKTWINVQDEPVINRGPREYDQAMIALDQVIKYEGKYYAYYHGLIPKSDPHDWTTNIATSTDLIHWEKYAGNPLISKDKSSPVLVQDGKEFRLYTMHPKVCLYLPKPNTKMDAMESK
jgi:beta-1,2-mannobiose phosphorylase / 1,2-beta-oligomannan phosphorylase